MHLRSGLLPAFLLAGLFPALSAGSVTSYHNGPARDGAFIAPGLSWGAASTLHVDANFQGAVKGAVYAQPLYWRPPGAAHGMLIVATEADEVDALDADTGRTVWRTQLGRPVPLAQLPCGDIDPLGITGTPVIDAARGVVYLDAMVEQDGAPQHLVFGLGLSDGKIMPGWPVNVQQALRGNFDPALQNQRGALMLLGQRLFIPYGGQFGDCGDYHGIVLGLATDPPHFLAAWATRGSKGGIWAPGGISAADGALFFTTGNTDAGADWADGEGVFRLAPDLARNPDPRAFFAPGNWKALDDEDLDISGVAPLPFDLPGGARRLLALGKDGDAYLLDRDNLGGFNGQIASLHVANSVIITGPAAFPGAAATETLVFQARNALCPDGAFSGGLAALALSAHAIRPLWCAALRGRGAPIVTTTDGHADPIVWVDGAEGDERLHAFRGDTGAPLFTSAAIPGVRRFATPIAANRHLYIAGEGRIVAFRWKS
jgi:hypothetical protein